jgi:hypothetical protein
MTRRASIDKRKKKAYKYAINEEKDTMYIERVQRGNDGARFLHNDIHYNFGVSLRTMT